MSTKAFRPGALIMIGLLSAGLAAAAGAGEQKPVMTLKPMKDAHLPAGSQISERRLQETDLKIKAFMAEQKARKLESSKETLPKAEGGQQ